jgi:hypothetical protein
MVSEIRGRGKADLAFYCVNLFYLMQLNYLISYRNPFNSLSLLKEKLKFTPQLPHYNKKASRFEIISFYLFRLNRDYPVVR